MCFPCFGLVINAIINNMTNRLEYIGLKEFVVEHFQEDLTGRIQWHELGFSLLRAAQAHAESQGFGYGPNSGTGVIWVLLRLSVEMYERPLLGERYVVHTWVDSIQKISLTRLFDICNAEGKVIGRAHSVWTLLDLDTRELAMFDAVNDRKLEACLLPRSDFSMQGMKKIRLKAATLVCERPIFYSDLDVNGHLNSVRILDMILDLLPLDKHKNLDVRRIDIAYSRESMLGDCLQCFIEKTNSGLLVELRKKNGETKVSAQIECNTEGCYE